MDPFTFTPVNWYTYIYINNPQIERVQNPTLYTQYFAKKKQMENAGGTNVERFLWHGTHGGLAVTKSINEKGFDRNYNSGKRMQAFQIKIFQILWFCYYYCDYLWIILSCQHTCTCSCKDKFWIFPYLKTNSMLEVDLLSSWTRYMICSIIQWSFSRKSKIQKDTKNHCALGFSMACEVFISCCRTFFGHCWYNCQCILNHCIFI